MECTKDLARKLCEEMGIEWDKAATNPTIRGQEIRMEELFMLGD